MASKFGFKRLTIRILDGETPTPDTNVFVVEGAQGKGATQTAKISGLSSDPIKTYGSDIAYYTSRKGVGDVKVDLGLVDLPDAVINKILGYKDKNGITVVGNETEAPYCSIMIESTTAAGKVCAYGFFKGSFSMNDEEIKTIEEKRDGLPTENYTFTSIGADSGDFTGVHQGKIFDAEAETVTKLKKALAIEATD